MWPVLRRLIPWLSFFALLAWGWRLDSLFSSIPAYGDNLEAVWGISWWFEHLTISHTSPAFTKMVFHPEGWHASTQSYGPLLYLASIPFTYLGGEAFSQNIVVILLFAFTYAGVYRLVRSLGASLFIAVLAGLLSTFWGFRWLRLAGHWQILWGASFLPWMAWALDKSITSGSRSRLWILFAGLLWAVAISGSLYFIFLGAFLVICWIAGQALGGHNNWRGALENLALTIIIALLASIPSFVWFWEGIRSDTTTLYNIDILNAYGASINSLPIPFLGHPWLDSLSQLIYSGPADESGVANMGLIATIIALVGVPLAWKRRSWRPLLLLMAIGFILAIGPTVKWNGESIRAPVFEPVNNLLWKAGHTLKPETFTSEDLPPSYSNAIPTPGFLATVFIPFWEGARTSSRYAIVASVGFFLLVALVVKETRPKWVKIFVAALLIVEIVPPPINGVDYPPETHPAFEWLARQDLGEKGIIDLHASADSHVQLPISAPTLFATQYHGKPTAAGVGSVWPAHGVFLRDWFQQNQNPFLRPELATILRDFQIRYILLHVLDEGGKAQLEQAEENGELNLVSCYSPPPPPSPWPFEICVLEIKPPTPESVDVFLYEGWSGRENWGVWAVSRKTEARWIATTEADHLLYISAFPYCLEDSQQTIKIKVNDLSETVHEWQDCDEWQLEILIPGSEVNIGWNQIHMEYGYALKPVEVTDGENPDPRSLSVGFTRLEVDS